MKSKGFYFILFLILFILLGCNFPGGETPAEPATDLPDQQQPPDDAAAPDSPTDTPLPAPQETLPPTDTPTPENTPGLAPGSVLYQTDFNNLPGWNSFAWWRSDVSTLAGSDFKTQIFTYVAEIRQGAYRFEVPKKYTNITAIYGADPGSADVTVTADSILTIERPWTFISVVCRYQENVGWYEFYIKSDGQWGIRKISYVNGTLFQVNDLANGFATAVKYGEHGILNVLQATCKGTSLIFTVNGVVLGAVEDSSYPSGLVGVGVAAGAQGNSIAEFNNLRVVVP